MDTTTPSIATSLPTPGDIDLLPAPQPLDASYSVGGTIIMRSATTAIREELFMERVRSQRIITTLRAQLDKAKRRRFRATRVDVATLDQLLTRLENADA